MGSNTTTIKPRLARFRGGTPGHACVRAKMSGLMKMGAATRPLGLD